MNIKITADSTCDLPASIIEKYNISIIPLHIIKGKESFKDGVEITPKDIFEYVDSGAGTCGTACVNISEYHDYFAEFLKDYDAIVHIALSSELSSSCQNAITAASDFENVYIVDSRNLSTGSGHLVIDACELAASGMDASEIAQKLRENSHLLEVSFIIDSLKYLRKGGRCSALAALGANVLKLKPCIEVYDGKMDVGKKYRGAFNKVIIQYVHDRLAGRTDIDTRRIFITYTTEVPDSIVSSVRDEVCSCQNFDEICYSNAGCTISNHCGTVSLGILFFKKA